MKKLETERDIHRVVFEWKITGFEYENVVKFSHDGYGETLKVSLFAGFTEVLDKEDSAIFRKGYALYLGDKYQAIIEEAEKAIDPIDGL